MTNQTTPTPNRTLCNAVLELIPAYALGATDPEDTRFVERHLHDCPEALAELALYSDITDALLFESELVAAPAELAAKIAQIPQAGQKNTSGSHLPITSPSVMKPNSFVTQPIPKPLDSVKPVERKPLRTVSVWQLGAAAAILILILVNVLWLSQLNNLQTEKQAILGQLTQQDDALEVLSAPDTVLTSLAATESAASPDLTARVLWSPSAEVAVLRVDKLPSIDPDRAYQLWLIDAAGNQFISMGTFRVAEDGTFVGVVKPSAAIGDFASLGITEEPAGGSQQPTSDPVLRGNI